MFQLLPSQHGRKFYHSAFSEAQNRGKTVNGFREQIERMRLEELLLAKLPYARIDLAYGSRVGAGGISEDCR
jgi:hypothetical protein